MDAEVHIFLTSGLNIVFFGTLAYTKDQLRISFALVITVCLFTQVPDLQSHLHFPIVAHGQSAGSTNESTSCHRHSFSNIHIFHDVHQYNKTLIDLHYNYFMYFSFSFSLLSFALSQPC